MHLAFFGNATLFVEQLLLLCCERHLLPRLLYVNMKSTHARDDRMLRKNERAKDANQFGALRGERVGRQRHAVAAHTTMRSAAEHEHDQQTAQQRISSGSTRREHTPK